jgi:hypothetical protein
MCRGFKTATSIILFVTGGSSTQRIHRQAIYRGSALRDLYLVVWCSLC